MVERLCSVGGMEDPADRGPEAILWVRASDYAALAAENARLNEQTLALVREVSTLRGENERLRGLLRRYGGHEDDCAGTAGYLDPRCTCGFSEALAADQPSDAMSAEEHCQLFCAWKGGGPCLADDCPRRNVDQPTVRVE